MAHTPKPIRKALKPASAPGERLIIIDEVWSADPADSSREAVSWLTRNARAKKTIEYDPKAGYLGVVSQLHGYPVGVEAIVQNVEDLGIGPTPDKPAG